MGKPWCVARLLPIAISGLLSAYGTVSGQESSADGAQEPLAISAYDAIVVGEFADRATENARFSGDSPEDIAELKQAYEADLATVRRNFSALLLNELKRTGVFTEVLPDSETPTNRALLIEGEITRFDRGSVAKRLFIGLGAGRLRFDAIVRVKDASTDADITQIEVDRGSGPLGGAIGVALTVEYFMQRAAINVASELRDAKCAAMVCEEAGPATVAAPAVADQAAKEFDIPSDQCAAYFYMSLPRNRSTRRGVEVWSDETSVGLLDDEDGYFVWSLEPGDHEIFTRYLSQRVRRSLRVECMGGTALFVHHDVRTQMIEELLLVPVREGQRDVRRRQLVLP